ncbi:hypothetical protein R2R35_20305 [Anaerocolumna sp. AGMB13020]|uniref:hypothetical protein n=1 Tax=Anaerocolumna sp. AGMB13020 TaxID=3081750 RepID=UPI002952E042|nr:hypothetical protein [Anaerocolumna sp. AGMB13020]WOO36117.1 hypothetical protein R2R35_20305 [Anaerocolumna sp. AGMB13020]
MKLSDLCLVFFVVEIIVFTVLDIRFEQLEAMAEITNAYNTALDNAVDDGCFYLVEVDSSRNLYTNKEAAVEQFFSSLYANLGVMGQSFQEEKLSRYIPVILVTDRDGFYIYYTAAILSGGEKRLDKRWSEKLHYVYEDDRYVIKFTLGNEIILFEKESMEIWEGEYRDIRELTECSFLEEEEVFETIRRKTIIQSISKNMNLYINYYNSIASDFGITYEFWLPEIDRTDWDRTIDDVSLFVLFQGYPYDAAALDTYNRYVFGGARIAKSKVYYINVKLEKKFYHSENCEEVLIDKGIPYYTKEECAKEGAFPCNKCIP